VEDLQRLELRRLTGSYYSLRIWENCSVLTLL